MHCCYDAPIIALGGSGEWFVVYIRVTTSEYSMGQIVNPDFRKQGLVGFRRKQLSYSIGTPSSRWLGNTCSNRLFNAPLELFHSTEQRECHSRLIMVHAVSQVPQCTSKRCGELLIHRKLSLMTLDIL